MDEAEKSLLSEKSSGIGQKVGEDIGWKIAPPDIQQGKNQPASSDGDQMDRSPSAKVGVGKRRYRDDDGERSVLRELPNLLD